MDLYRGRLFWRPRRRPPRPVVGEAAMTPLAVWPAIGSAISLKSVAHRAHTTTVG
jgi:hypothetical protein